MTNTSSAAPIIVIGAGIGGLTTAIRLATAGLPVIVLEQQEQPGGKMGEVSADGYRWDTGPSVITMRPVIEELFESSGRKMTDYLNLQPVDPLTRYFFPDGTRIDVSSDLRAMAAELAQLGEQATEDYLAFLTYAARLHRITGPAFVYGPPPSPATLTQIAPHRFLQVDPWLTLDQAIQRRIRSPHLRQIMARFATYVGANPFQAPATLGVIAHIELTQGVWYPSGGIYQIASALASVAAELGVDIRCEQTVEQIVVEAGHASGVRMADGRIINARAVVANVDVTTVYQHLLPAAVAGANRRRHMAAMNTSCSGFALLLGIEGNHPSLSHHNIFFSSDYQHEFQEIFEQGIPPSEPTIYVAITSKTDPDHAPPGCENWFVLVNAPALGPTFDWQQDAPRYRNRVLELLASYGYDLQNRIRFERSLTPNFIARQTGAWRGALYGISSNQALNAFRRPHNRCPHLKSLYFVGGTTHPGGGVPMVMLSAKVACNMLTSDLQVAAPA